jgi:hypothetical protein
MSNTNAGRKVRPPGRPRSLIGRITSLGLEMTKQRAIQHIGLVHDSPRLFMSAAVALLQRSDLAAAICGDKSALDRKGMPGVSQTAYYNAYFRFAHEKGSLAVVRLFGRWDAKRKHRLPLTVDEKFSDHKARRNVLGLRVDNAPFHVAKLMTLPGFGVVLFRGSAMVTALLHWNGGDSGFCWTITSDPLVTAILLDTWSELSSKATVDANGNDDSRWGASLASFRSRFGMATRRSDKP